MDERFSRTQRLYGRAAMERLQNSRVAVFGVGGVGGYVVEALARSGVGALDLIDHDRVSLSNLNRQIIATQDTIGREKTEVAAERVASINPECRVTVHPVFFLPETQDEFDFTQYDYVVDAIDTVAGKMAIIEKAREAGVPVISAMGAGNKIRPSMFEVADIYKTSVCPLAKVIRRECRKRGIRSLKVVYSREEPLSPLTEAEGGAAEEPAGATTKRRVPGSTAFSPSVAGLIIAGEVVNDLTSAEFRASRKDEGNVKESDGEDRKGSCENFDPVKATATGKLYILRHGKTEWNIRRKLQGQTDVPLCDEGRAMAAEAGERYKDVHFDVCYCSPLSRARETAELLLRGRDIPIIFDDRLKEVSFGVYEGIESSFNIPDCPVNEFFYHPEDYRTPVEGGESTYDLMERTGSFLREVVQPQLAAGKDVLIVGHGAMNMSIAVQARNIPVKDFWKIGIKNCELICLTDEEQQNPCGNER